MTKPNTLFSLYPNRYFILFIALFAYLQSIYTRILGRQIVDIYTFTPEAAVATLMGTAVLFLIILFFIRKWQKQDQVEKKVLLKIFATSLSVYVIAMLLIGLFIAFLFGNIERNYTQESIRVIVLSHLLDGVIYGSFFLAYYYYQLNSQHQEKLALYHQALSESKINQLKNQLNPHFLFNNLNILDQLIEEDKNTASDFLNQFAEIYRYVLQSSEQELIPIEKELEFAKNYFNLIQFKYGIAYQLLIDNTTESGLIVPMTLQLLIENAIQHNLGTEKNPLIIHMDQNHIKISNEIRKKKSYKTTSGRGLKNLQEQYALLSEIPVIIEPNDTHFMIQVPIIHS